MRNCADFFCVCNSIRMNPDRTALRWHIPASLRSLWWASAASRSDWGDSASHFFLIYHFLQQWNLPLCSDTSTGSITHSSDGLTARMSVCVCVCVAVLCVCEFVWAISQLCVRVWICVDVCALSSPLTTHMHTKAFLFQKCITVSFSEDVTGQV